MPDHARPSFATYVGLFCAMVLPLLGLPLQLLHHAGLRVGFIGQEGFFWGLAALVLCILVFAEKLPLSAIGLGRPTWKSLLWGIAGAVAVRVAAAAVLMVYALFSGISMQHAFGHDLATAERLGALPAGALILLALRAGFTEEILFRGYGIERLAAVTNNRAVAALASLVLFTLAHLGVWDLNYLIVVFPVGLVLTLQYLWRRDLWANICTHFLTDAVSLLGAYAIAHHLVQLPTGA